MSKLENLTIDHEACHRVKDILSNTYENIPLAFVHSFGCQQNISDGEKIKGMLAQMGYGFTNSLDDADFILYNTCAVRESAETKILGNVGELKARKARKPQMIVSLSGCMMQQAHMAEKIKKSYPFVDIVFGTHVTHLLPEMILEKLNGTKRVIDIRELPLNQIAENIPTKRDGSIKAGMPIMYGCDNFCTYCIVPYVRGREKSRTSEDIIAEAKQLIAEGYKEITLLGQNVNSYGKGLGEEISFSKLLRKLNSLDGDFIIRFMTSHPKDCTRELIDTIAECDKVCNHIHLPVQSGSNKVLSDMNRHYTKEHYMELVTYAKSKIPDISFTSDIIVGFPTENYNDFLETIDLVNMVKFENLYTFIYSKRSGTKAADFERTATDKEISQWFSELLKVQDTMCYDAHTKLLGKTLRVLAQGEGKTGEDYLTGRTEGNIIVDFKAPKDYIGKFVWVEITKAMHWSVLGELRDNKN